MRLVFLKVFVLVTLLSCFARGQDGENSVSEHSQEKSRFKKFLNLFGIGTMKQFQPGDNVHDFSPYGYPCPTVTTTTTPSPVVSPMLCPFPPVMPGQMRPLGFGVNQEIPPGLPRPVALDYLPPPPPINHPMPGFKPLPGQNPPFPGQFQPLIPNPNIPRPVPNQIVPQPNQVGPQPPVLVGPMNPLNPGKPMLVDPVNPKDPVKVTPSVVNPSDPIKVNPTLPETTSPIQVNPVDVYPNLPMLVDPVHPGQPLYVNPTLTPMDPKEFSKHQPILPYGPMNVLVNPGLPDGPFTPPPAFSGNLGPPPSLNVTPPAVTPVVPPKQPEQPRPLCASPFLRPYIPNGFHFSSVRQLAASPPLPNKKLFPCPTLDLLTVLEFKTMRSLIDSSGLAPLVDRTRNYTIFVPSDAAFRRLPKWFRESLDADSKLKKALVLNHLVKEDLPLEILKNEELILSARPGGNRLRANIYQSGNSYRTITLDGSEVEIGDILTSNGRVHIVNKVLMPNLPRNGAQFLSEKLEFESFWNLVKQADMVQRFQEDTPITVFIPVNEAVKKLNDSAFLHDKDKVKNFINYHMVNGTYYSSGIINNEFLLTNYEKEIKLQTSSDVFSKSLSGINGKVRILKADISLTNGVAHVIDQCISEETPFYVYPQSDEFKNEFGVMKRSFRVTGKEKNIENAF